MNGDNHTLSGRNRTWRGEQKQAFGRRLAKARKAAGYRKGSDFIEALQARRPDARVRTYYSHEAGDRVPDDDVTIDIYAEMLSVSRDFLLFGAGEDFVDTSLNDSDEPVNQGLEVFNLNPSQMGKVRYIPILTASDIKALLTGQGSLTTMSRESLPVPQHLAAGARSFAYQIPQHDNSMVGPEGPSFAPGTYLMIDPDRDIMPGDFLLAWPSDMPAPVFRRFQGSHPITPSAPRYPFKLLALSPHAEPLVIERASACRILGRMVSSVQNW